MAIKNNILSQEEYEHNFSDIHPPFERLSSALVEANRCLFCYDAPCTNACPTSIDVPQFIKQIVSRNEKGSAKTIFDSNIFGAGCSRVCPVEKLCEGACVFNLLDEPPIPIAKLQRYSTEKAIAGKWDLYLRKKSIGKKVAIVGAGPAGLSCAHGLSLEGIDVTIFEKNPRGGGLMTYGVAAYKVTPEFCQDEIDWITSIGGIEIKYNSMLGRDFTLESLKTNYDAIFLAIGVGVTRELDIPGEELEGVVDAINFIHGIRSMKYSEIQIGDKVAVIGMGMTAIDAATQSKRLGAKEVNLIYRRTEKEKPCTDAELELARLDGCNIIWLASPAEIIGENGKVTGIKCNKLSLVEPDSSGRAAPKLTGETFTLSADMIIKATGQLPFSDLLEIEKIEHSKGKINTFDNQKTNLSGVFAGGDCVNGGEEVVNAVQDGKIGALSILKYLCC